MPEKRLGVGSTPPPLVLEGLMYVCVLWVPGLKIISKRGGPAQASDVWSSTYLKSLYKTRMKALLSQAYLSKRLLI